MTQKRAPSRRKVMHYPPGGHWTPAQAFFTAGTGTALNVLHCEHAQQMCYNSTGKTYAPNRTEQ